MRKDVENPCIRICLWELQGVARGNEDFILACARDYAAAFALDESAEALRLRPTIARSERGKPYFLHVPDLHFSLTHSGLYGACAFCTQGVGLDLQVHSHRDLMKIARRFFHPQESAYLENHGFETFFQIWTAKESYMKYTGEGLSMGLNAFSVVNEDGLLARMGEVAFRHDAPWAGYSMCLCAREIGHVEILYI